MVEHARAVFDLMGADPRVGDARWLLDWIIRTDQVQFSRRDAHQAARGRFRKATDLEPALRLLEEHGYLRRVDPEPSRDPHGRGRPASPRFVVNPLHPSSETTETTKPPPNLFLWFLRFLRRPTGARGDHAKAHRHQTVRGHRTHRRAHRGLSRYPTRTDAAVSGHACTRLRPPRPATSLPWPPKAASATHWSRASAGRSTRFAADSSGVVTAERLGRRARWPR